MSKASHHTGGTDPTTSSDGRRTDANESDERPVAQTPGDDELFDILSNRRRRFALHFLWQRPNGPVSLASLSERVAAWEQDVDPEELDYQHKKSVRNSLRQFHLPKLDDAGVVAFDDDAGEVELVDGTGADAYHDVVGESEDRHWMAYFMGVAAGSVGVFLLVSVGVLTVLAEVAWVALGVGTLAVAAAAYAYAAGRADGVRDGPPPECQN